MSEVRQAPDRGGGRRRGKKRIVTWPPNGYTPNKGIDESSEIFDIDPLAWRSGLDVEALPDGIRRRNGLIFSSDTLGTEEAANATGTEDFTPITVGQTRAAQSFTLAAPATIESVEIFLRMNDIPPVPVPIFLQIQTDVAGEPSGIQAAALNFTSITTQALTTSYQEIIFSAANPLQLAAGTYWIVVRASGLPTGDFLFIKADMDGNPYAGGKAGIFTTSWGFGGDDDDLVFAVNNSGVQKEITAIHDFKDGFDNTKHVVVFTQTAYDNVSGALTAIGSFDTDHGKDVHPSLASCDGRLCMTNGVSGDPSKKFYISGGNQFENEGISKPTAQLSATGVDSGGNLEEGEYFVDYYYVNKDTPREIISNPRDEGNTLLAVSATISIGQSDGRIDVADMASDIARTNDRATHKRLMILGPGTANKWIETGVEVLIGTTTATISDTGLFGAEAEFDHDVPPVHSIKMAGSERQFIAGIEGQPKRVQWTRARGTLVSVESYPAFNRKDLGVGDDKTTALALVPPSTVLVGMRNSIWSLDETQPSRPAELISNRVGIAGHKSVTVIGRQAFFWSDSEQHKGPFKFDGRNVVPLIALDKTVNGEKGTPNLNLSRVPLISCAHYAAGDTRFQWWSSVTQAGQSDHDLILVYDYNLDSWMKYRISANILGEVEVASLNALFVGTILGREVQADRGDDDLGTEIQGDVTLRPLTFGDLHNRTHIRGMITRSQTTNLGDLLLVLTSDLDFGGEASSVTVILNQAGTAGDILGTDTLPFRLAGSGELLRVHSFRSIGRVFEPRFFGTSPWYLNRLAWRVQESGRK